MKKPFPFSSKLKHHYWVALGLALWIVLFLYFSKPFGLIDLPKSKLLILLPFYGFLQSISYLLSLLYQKKSYLNSNKWTLGNELVFLGLTVFFGLVLNFIFYKYVVVSDSDLAYGLFKYLKLFYFPAVIIVLPFIGVTRFLLGSFYAKQSYESKITIKGKGKYDFINLRFETLLFIKSADNYIEINFIEGKTLNKKLIRGTISEVENSYPKLLKTHRSYLVNTSRFKQFVTQNKKLFLDLDYGVTVPVSRSLQTAVKKAIQLTTNK